MEKPLIDERTGDAVISNIIESMPFIADDVKSICRELLEARKEIAKLKVDLKNEEDHSQSLQGQLNQWTSPHS